MERVIGAVGLQSELQLELSSAEFFADVDVAAAAPANPAPVLGLRLQTGAERAAEKKASIVAMVLSSRQLATASAASAANWRSWTDCGGGADVAAADWHNCGVSCGENCGENVRRRRAGELRARAFSPQPPDGVVVDAEPVTFGCSAFDALSGPCMVSHRLSRGAELALSIDRTEGARTNMETVRAMKQGASAMQNMQAEIGGVESIDSVMDDVREQMDLANEIAEAVAQPMGGAEITDTVTRRLLERASGESVESTATDASFESAVEPPPPPPTHTSEQLARVSTAELNQRLDAELEKYAKTSRFGSTAHSSDDLARYAGTAALALSLAFYASQSFAGNGLLDFVYARLECHTC